MFQAIEPFMGVVILGLNFAPGNLDPEIPWMSTLVLNVPSAVWYTVVVPSVVVLKQTLRQCEKTRVELLPFFLQSTYHIVKEIWFAGCLEFNRCIKPTMQYSKIREIADRLNI